jgi:hypothetical protein
MKITSANYMFISILQEQTFLSFFRNESGVIADITLRFGNDSKNLVSLDSIVKLGALGTLPVDPASLKAGKLEILFITLLSKF